MLSGTAAGGGSTSSSPTSCARPACPSSASSRTVTSAAPHARGSGGRSRNAHRRLVGGVEQAEGHPHRLLPAPDVLPSSSTTLTPQTRAKVVAVDLLGLAPPHRLQVPRELDPLLPLQGAAVPRRAGSEEMQGLKRPLHLRRKGKRLPLPGLPPQIVTKVRMPGRHHFDGRYPEIARAILRAAERGGEVADSLSRWSLIRKGSHPEPFGSAQGRLSARDPGGRAVPNNAGICAPPHPPRSRMRSAMTGSHKGRHPERMRGTGRAVPKQCRHLRATHPPRSLAEACPERSRRARDDGQDDGLCEQRTANSEQRIANKRLYCLEYSSMIRSMARRQTRQKPTSSRVNMMQSVSGR